VFALRWDQVLKERQAKLLFNFQASIVKHSNEVSFRGPDSSTKQKLHYHRQVIAELY
jgi:hypothetical protein